MAAIDAGKIHQVSIHAPVKGRRYFDIWANCGIEVSIHAPVKGRPVSIAYPYSHCFVSIHAPVKGRHPMRCNPRYPCGFNPRPREGATEV